MVCNCLSLISWKEYPFPGGLSWRPCWKSDDHICVGLFLDSPSQSLSSQLCVNSKHRRSHCFPDALICDLRHLPPTCMDQLSAKDSRDALCRSGELAFASSSLQGLTPILATVGSPQLPLPHHALRIPPWKLCNAGVCHTSFLSFLSGMKAHMWPDVQCLETILLRVIFCFIAKDQSGPYSSIRVRRGSQRWFLNVSMAAPFSSPQNFVCITLLSFNNECYHTRVWGQLYFFSLITTVLFWWHSCKSLYSWNAVAWPEYILYRLFCISFCFLFWDCLFNISFGSLQIQCFFVSYFCIHWNPTLRHTSH